MSTSRKFALKLTKPKEQSTTKRSNPKSLSDDHKVRKRTPCENDFEDDVGEPLEPSHLAKKKGAAGRPPAAAPANYSLVDPDPLPDDLPRTESETSGTKPSGATKFTSVPRSDDRVLPMDDIDEADLNFDGETPHTTNSLETFEELNLCEDYLPRPACVTSGIAELDAKQGGHRGLTILAGPSRSGKTSFALQTAIAAMMANPKLGVLLLAFEQRDKQVIHDHFLCMLSGISFERLAAGHLDRTLQLRLDQSLAFLRSNIYPRMRIVVRAPESELGFSQDEFVGSWNVLNRTGKVTDILTIIDRLQILPLPPRKAEQRSVMRRLCDDAHANAAQWRAQQIAAARASLLSCGIDRPIIAISEVRKVDHRQKELELEDLLGSVELAYEADRILFLKRNGVTEGGITPVRLSVAKARGGSECQLDLSFHFSTYRFEQLIIEGWTLPEVAGGQQQSSSKFGVAANGKSGAPLRGRVIE